MPYMEEEHNRDGGITEAEGLVSDDRNKTEDVDDEQIKHASEISSQGQNLKSKFIWMLVFVLIAALTISTMAAQGGLTLQGFLSFLSSLELPYLLGAVTLMIAYILLEGLAILTIIKSFGYKKGFLKGFVYASGDIYFSAITPSATGGQPASAYFMMKDGIPGAVVTVSLVVNLIMYTFAIIAIGIVSFIVDPGAFLGFSTTSKIIIAVGMTLLAGVGCLFLLVLFKGNILRRSANAVISFLVKIKLVRKPEKMRKKLEDFINSYEGYVSQLGGKRWMLIRAFIFNFLQRSAIIAVTTFTYLAAGGDASLVIRVTVIQSLVVLGSNPVPIPGGMGISDILLIDGFGTIGFNDAAAHNLNLLSRTVSFYSCVLLCGISIVIRLVTYKIAAARSDKRLR